jgi:hypothetical protein
VYVEALQLTVTPGGEATFPVIVLNQGPETDRFEVSVVGGAANWASISPSVIQLPSGTEREVTLTFRPLRSPQSRAGPHGFKIQVISQNDPGQVAEVARTLTVAAYSQFESNLQPHRIDAGQPTRIEVENQGNAQDTFDLEWHSQANDLVFEIPKKQLQVSPGQVASVEFQAAPRQRTLIGGTRAHLFLVQVSSSDSETQTHDGKVVSTGLVPAWFLPLFLSLCVALAAVGTFGYWAIINTRKPSATIAAQTAAVQTPDVTAAETAAAEATAEAATAATAEAATATLETLKTATQTAIEAATATKTWMEQDDDRDGLTNGQELDLGTLSTNRDTDDDDLDDGDELERNTNPLEPDTDGDGWKDGYEITQGTNPLKKDTDGDVTPDPIDPDPGRPPTATPTETATPTPTFTPPPPTPTTPPPTPLTQPLNIPFTYADDFGSGLTVHAVRAENTGTYVEFQFDYTSDDDRVMSFFDPPDGDTISIKEYLSPGTNSVLIVTSVNALQRVSYITVIFYIPGGDETGAIFLDFKEIEKILPSTPAAPPPSPTPIMQPLNIPFIYADDFGSGLTVHAVRAHNTGTNVEFQFDYTSDADRGMSFFDPPDGDTISIQEDLPAGTNSVLIVASVSALQRVSYITVNFYIPGVELTGSIFLDFQEIEKIIP